LGEEDPDHEFGYKAEQLMLLMVLMVLVVLMVLIVLTIGTCGMLGGGHCLGTARPLPEEDWHSITCFEEIRHDQID